MTNEEKIPLAFFDVQNKKIFIKIDEKFVDCTITSDDSLLYNEDKYKFVEINIGETDIMEIFEGMKNQVEIQGKNLIGNAVLEEKSENKIDCEIYKQSLNREIIPNKRVAVKESDASFLSNKNNNIVTAFKINKMKCFSYYDNDLQKMQYKEIKDGKAKDLEVKDIKIYFLKKKTKSSI